jgi:hypothetical protein
LVTVASSTWYTDPVATLDDAAVALSGNPDFYNIQVFQHPGTGDVYQGADERGAWTSWYYNQNEVTSGVQVTLELVLTLLVYTVVPGESIVALQQMQPWSSYDSTNFDLAFETLVALITEGLWLPPLD